MKKATFRLSAVIALALVSATALYAQRVVSAFGQAQVAGKKVLVHVSVVVPPGLDGNQVAQAALRDQGARPFQGDEFSTTGLVWDQFFNAGFADEVIQNYNPANDPFNDPVVGETLRKTHATWGGVGTSKFAFLDGGTTGRCPSLVRECPGPQYFDLNNDVAWLPLKGCCTLGVTWFSTSIDEADMALNTNFNWGAGGFDAETVFLHENGHVFGAGHSDIPQAVMFPSYQGVLPLHCDDQQVISFLYPAANSTGSIGGTVTTDGTTPAVVAVEHSPLSDTTDGNGNYLIEGVPAVCTYDVTASADGFESQTQTVTVPNTGVIFTLTATNGGDDDGGGGGGGGGALPKGASCEQDSECNSNKCKGPPGAKTCKQI